MGRGQRTASPKPAHAANETPQHTGAAWALCKLRLGPQEIAQCKAPVSPDSTDWDARADIPARREVCIAHRRIAPVRAIQASRVLMHDVVTKCPARSLQRAGPAGCWRSRTWRHVGARGCHQRRRMNMHSYTHVADHESICVHVIASLRTVFCPSASNALELPQSLSPPLTLPPAIDEVACGCFAILTVGAR